MLSPPHLLVTFMTTYITCCACKLKNEPDYKRCILLSLYNFWLTSFYLVNRLSLSSYEVPESMPCAADRMATTFSVIKVLQITLCPIYQHWLY